MVPISLPKPTTHMVLLPGDLSQRHLSSGCRTSVQSALSGDMPGIVIKSIQEARESISLVTPNDELENLDKSAFI